MSAKNLYLAAYATNDTMLAQAVAAYPHKDVRYLLGTHDMCNCKTAGFTNDNFCYPAACATKANLEGRRCCDTYPDSSTSNALDVTCNAMLQARGFSPSPIAQPQPLPFRSETSCSSSALAPMAVSYTYTQAWPPSGEQPAAARPQLHIVFAIDCSRRQAGHGHL